MYESHFGFTRSPFRLTADPAFFFQTAQHRKALAYLEYGWLQREGFVALSGAPGLGKSLLVNSILASTQGSSHQAAIVSGYPYNDTEFLLAIAYAFDIKTIDHTAPRAAVLKAICDHLTLARENGQRVSLVIDDAQRIPTASLRELEPLLDLESGSEALLHITLVGTPDFRDSLARPELSRFVQFMYACANLKPLSSLMTREYLEHRLTVCRWHGNPALEDNAVSLIHDYSHGVPRSINILADRLLLDCYLADRTIIGAPDVDRVYLEMHNETATAASKEIIKTRSERIRDSSEMQATSETAEAKQSSSPSNDEGKEK